MGAHDFASYDFASLHSLDAEHSVLGALLIVPASFDRVSDLEESDFFVESHRLIYRRIASMHASRKPVDVVTVSDSLQSVGELDRIGGFGFLAELASNVSGASNIRRYAEMIRDKRMLRDLLAASGDIAQIATASNGMAAGDRIDAAQAKLLALSQSKAGVSEPVLVSSLLSEALSELERRVELGGKVTGVSSGFTDLDRITNGFQRGDLVIVAGRPSMGKTALAVNVAERVAMDGGVSLIFSLEMPKNQVVERLITSVGTIDNERYRKGSLNEEEYERLSFAISRLDGAKIEIDDATALSVSQMAGRARRVKQRHGRLDLIVVDYLQLMGMGPGAKSQNRNEEISAITRGLKMLARDLELPVIALSQLSRKVEERTDKRPMMSDLRESGAIEQDADLILMTYRDEYYNPDSAFKGLAEVLIRKHRMGETGEIKMVFQGQYSRFRDADASAVSAAYSAASSTRAPKKRGFGE